MDQIEQIKDIMDRYASEHIHAPIPQEGETSVQQFRRLWNEHVCAMSERIEAMKEFVADHQGQQDTAEKETRE